MQDENEKLLFEAIKKGDVATAKRLFDTDLNLNCVDMHRGTPLYYAVCYGRVEMIKLLLEAGASLVDGYGWSHLCLASGNGHTEIVEILLGVGVKPNLTITHEPTPIFWASGNGHAEVVKLLLSAGADFNSSDRCGKTPLYQASRFGHVEVIKLLLDANADPNLADNTGKTPLYWASKFGRVEVVKLLLDSDANFNLADTYGYTPLYQASRNGNSEVVKLLLDAGVDLNLTDKFGRFPLDAALSSPSGKDFIIDLLENWPRVVPLRILCLRIIRVKTNKVFVPAWLPPVLLEWPSAEEVTGISPKSPAKRQKR